MNSKYIKRQLTLHEIGISMSDDTKKYYDAFNQVIGNIDDLEKRISGRDIYWSKEKNHILLHKESGYMYVHDSIVNKFIDLLDNSYGVILTIIKIFLEYFLNINITFIFKSGSYYINYCINEEFVKK